MALELQVNPTDAQTVLLHPEIRETISEDGTEEWMPPEGPIYLCGYVPELMGCFVLHQEGAVTWECHVQVLPDYRSEWAESFGQAVMAWAWENTGALKIVARIPELYPNVRKFAESQGFETEGFSPRSYLKNSRLYGQWHMGVSRGVH